MKQTSIYKLHEKYSHGKNKEKILEIGWTHSLIVKTIAIQIADKLKTELGIETDKKLIEIGALVHDIGFYDCFDDNRKKKCEYVLHGKMGYQILLKEGFSRKRARFALTHVGVGIDKETVPITIEEEIVCYADNFHSKGHPRFDSYEEIKNDAEKINKDFAVILDRFKDKFGIPSLVELEDKYRTWHKDINAWVDTI